MDRRRRLKVTGLFKAAMALFVRKYLRADLVDSDWFIEPLPYGVLRSRPSDFLDGGKAFRWGEILWRLLILCAATGLSIIDAIFMGPIFASSRLLFPMFVMVPMFLGALSVVLASQAYLRWMFKNLNRPQGASVEVQ